RSFAKHAVVRVDDLPLHARRAGIDDEDLHALLPIMARSLSDESRRGERIAAQVGTETKSGAASLDTPRPSTSTAARSDHAEREHRVGDLLEARDVGAEDVVARLTVRVGRLDAARVDATH